ncbi:MAG: NAD(P)H-dependent oxidoreductase [Candidatus Lokiarchaeota archaeon]|nr:NAD(P)H-dependent oxidoreductase [Candidatus Lokiarchaeota archaeon]
MPKTLVVYYSLEGSSKLVAEAIAGATGAEMLRLEPIKDIDASKSTKYLWGGKDVLMRKKPELKAFDKNPEDYDVLFIGGPVWAWSFCPALRTFLTLHKPAGKKVAAFLSCGGDPKKAMDRLREQLEGNEILGDATFIEPVHKETEKQVEKAKAWAKEMLAK